MHGAHARDPCVRLYDCATCTLARCLSVRIYALHFLHYSKNKKPLCSREVNCQHLISSTVTAGVTPVQSTVTGHVFRASRTGSFVLDIKCCRHSKHCLQLPNRRNILYISSNQGSSFVSSAPLRVWMRHVTRMASARACVLGCLVIIVRHSCMFGFFPKSLCLLPALLFCNHQQSMHV